MLSEPYYYRSPSFLYPLQSHPSYWFYVGRSASEQAIIGLVTKDLCVIVFDDKGNLIKMGKRPLAPMPFSVDARDLGPLHAQVENEVAQIRRERGWTDETIRVKRFRLLKQRAWIDDLPEDLQEYVVNRGLSGPMEEDLEEALEGWKEESLFVFYWDAEFYVNCEGLVTSS